MGIGEGYVFRTGNGWCENLRFLSSSLFFLSRPSFRLPLPRAAAPAETKLNQSPPPLAGSLFFLCFDKKEGGRGGRRGKGVWGNFLLFPPLKCECGLHGLGRRSPPLRSLFAFGCFWFMSVGKTTSWGGRQQGAFPFALRGWVGLRSCSDKKKDTVRKALLNPQKELSYPFKVLVSRVQCTDTPTFDRPV